MHILLVAINYAPEHTGIAPFNTGLCEHLVAQGHCVTVLTGFPHYPQWKVPAPYAGKLFLREQRNGVSVRRGSLYVPSRRSTLRRIAYDSSLALPAFLQGLGVGHVDVVLAVSPPLQLAAAAWALARLKGATFLLQVQDLVPDIAVALGMLRNRTAIHLAESLERFLYRRAQHVLVICPGFVENLRAKGVPGKKLLLIPDWTDTESIVPLPRDNEFRARHGISEQSFVVLYPGNLGAKQGMENVLAAAALAGDRDLLFLLVGDGTEKPRLEVLARERQVANVRFLPLQPADQMPQMLAAADVLLLNQLASVVDMVIPSKLLSYLAAARPVVAAIQEQSEAARTIRAAHCGLIIPPEQPAALLDAVMRLRHEPALGQRLGACGRQYAEEHFAKKKVLARYAEFFESLAETVPRATQEAARLRGASAAPPDASPGIR